MIFTLAQQMWQTQIMLKMGNKQMEVHNNNYTQLVEWSHLLCIQI